MGWSNRVQYCVRASYFPWIPRFEYGVVEQTTAGIGDCKTMISRRDHQFDDVAVRLGDLELALSRPRRMVRRHYGMAATYD